MPRASSWPACHTASAPVVIISGLIDATLVAVPVALTVTVAVVQHTPALRVTALLTALMLLLALLAGHCLHGRGTGGWLLGLRCVDDVAGLPPASARALLAVLRAGHCRGTTVYNVRRGKDPSRGTLQDLSSSRRTVPQAAAVPSSAFPAPQQAVPYVLQAAPFAQQAAAPAAPAAVPQATAHPAPPPPPADPYPLASGGSPAAASGPAPLPPSFAPATRHPRHS